MFLFNRVFLSMCMFIPAYSQRSKREKQTGTTPHQGATGWEYSALLSNAYGKMSNETVADIKTPHGETSQSRGYHTLPSPIISNRAEDSFPGTGFQRSWKIDPSHVVARNHHKTGDNPICMWFTFSNPYYVQCGWMPNLGYFNTDYGYRTDNKKTLKTRNYKDILSEEPLVSIG